MYVKKAFINSLNLKDTCRLGEVHTVVKCPYCGYEGRFELLKTWRYSRWDVHYYECPRCAGRFGFYLEPSGRCRSFIVKFRPRAR